MDVAEDTALDAVLASFETTKDPRLRQVVRAVATHLHALVRELRPTQREWEQAIDYLTAVGHTCSPTRQEFVLLSDVLGVSMLVETLNTGTDGTESTVLGPFHMTRSPRRALGESIDLLGGGRRAVVSGTVTDLGGAPVAGAEVDVWQCDENGLYDVQSPRTQPPGNGRGLFRTDAQGRFRFRTVVPSHYPIPTDGPVGALLDATGRHPYRPAHIHFLVDAPGFDPLTTHMFVAKSPYIDDDAVFAVKEGLICEFTACHDEVAARRSGTSAPFWQARFDIRLAPMEANHEH